MTKNKYVTKVCMRGIHVISKSLQLDLKLHTVLWAEFILKGYTKANRNFRTVLKKPKNKLYLCKRPALQGICETFSRVLVLSMKPLHLLNLIELETNKIIIKQISLDWSLLKSDKVFKLMKLVAHWKRKSQPMLRALLLWLLIFYGHAPFHTVNILHVMKLC